jgi:hypothetical protein
MLCQHAENANFIVFGQPFINIMASRTDANEYYKQFVRPETIVTRYVCQIHFDNTNVYFYLYIIKEMDDHVYI